MAPKKAMKKAVKKKPSKKGAAEAASGPQSAGRGDFSSTVFNASKEAPLGGVPAAQCDGAHAGVPASVGLQNIWENALKSTYDKKAAKEWTQDACIKGRPSCMHLHKLLHAMYDHNNKKQDDDTNMVAFLPTNILKKVPSPDKGGHFEAFILARGHEARKAVQSFLAGVCVEHGLFKTEEEDVFEIGKKPVLMTILKTRPKSLDDVVSNLREQEFNYDEVKTLSILGHDGKLQQKADYNCITKAGIEAEVKCVANLKDVNIDKMIDGPAGKSPGPAWLYNGTDKYVKVHVSGVVHWFNLRVRACRLLRHRHLGGLPNRDDDDECASPDMTMSEEERLRAAPLAWELSSTQLKESA